MRNPHVCPVCAGSGVYAPGPVTTVPPTRSSHPCHACEASGVVWEPAEAPLIPTITIAPAPIPFTTYPVDMGTTTAPTPYVTMWSTVLTKPNELDDPAAVPA